MSFSMYDTWYLSLSLSHMKDKSLIDERCMYLTIQLKDRNDFEKLTYDIHHEIKTMVTKKTYH